MDDQAVKDSFARCEVAGDFAESFYGVFLNASSEVAPLFKDTDFKKQRKLLRGSVFMMVARPLGDPKARAALERVGQSHSRAALNIRPELYDIWLDSLCKTVAQLDPDFSPELEEAWRARMCPGIELILSLY